MAQPIVSSDLGASHTLLSSQPHSHLSSSQKDDISPKGLVVSVGDNTPIADATPLATDPGHLSSSTAPAVNVSPLSHGEIQADISVSNDPSASTQADDDEETQPMDTSTSDDEQPPPPSYTPYISVTTAAAEPTSLPFTTASPATIAMSPLQELTAMSLSSDNISMVAGDDPHAETDISTRDQVAQSKPQPTPPTSPPKQQSPTQQPSPTKQPSPPKQTSPPTKPTSPISPSAQHGASSSSTDKLLMEYIASSQQQIKMLTEERDVLKSNLTDLTAKVHSLASVYEPIPSWSSSISEKVKTLAEAGLNHTQLLATQSKALSDLTTTTRINILNHDEAITSLTDAQQSISSSVLEYIQTNDQIIALIPKVVTMQQATKAEVSALRIDFKKLTRWVKGSVSAFYSNMGEKHSEQVPDEMDVTKNADHNQIIFDGHILRTIAERPENEAEVVAELSWLNMDVEPDDDDDFDPIDFPEFHPDELRMYDAKVKEWAADEKARIEGESVSYELARWQWMNRKDDDVIMSKGNGDDGNDDDNHDKDADNKEDDDDEHMEDQQLISSVLLKRKRTSESPTTASTSSKHKKQTITEEDISATIHHLQIILEKPDSPATTNINPQPITSATQQLTIPLTTSATQPSEATTVTTSLSSLPTASAPPKITMPETSTSVLLLSSESTSEGLLPEETKEQRIARKIKARQDREREMILKIQAEAELKEEEERKQRLKELSDSDRAYLLKLSGQEAMEREREIRLKREQEESDAVFARVLQSIEDSEKQQKLVAADPKKRKEGKTSVDTLWDEIDRKRYAARMVGRSNPAPITKVNLKKPKNKSQAQLLIHRGLEAQAINLDQVCKLHREEWNEIRLAVSHSSSAAKKEVLNEIERLFKKMVDLQLLRPEDTVIHGEEVVQPPSPRYRSGTSSIHRIPNTSKLNLSIPDGVPREEGFESTEGERGLVYRDLYGALRFQREAELEKIDHEQLVHLIRSASMLDTSSHMRKAILEEALARQFRYLPSTEKYELADELGLVKDEEIWRYH